jgi:hypothetical protein
MANEKDDIRVNSGWPKLEFRIQEKTDPAADQLLGIADNDERMVFIHPEIVFIKKGAMSSGKSSVTIYAKTKQGEHIFFETSGRMLNMIASAVNGIDGESLY